MATFARAFLPGIELEVISGSEMIAPDPGAREADPAWHLVDSNGHGHFVQDRRRYPTLRWVSEPCTMGHGDDCDAEGHYECRICGEEIRPGTRPARAFRVDRPDSYRLTIADGDQQVTYAFGAEQWGRLHAGVLDVVRNTLGGYEVASRSGSEAPAPYHPAADGGAGAPTGEAQ